MDKPGIQTAVNTNPMVFEELATSLATLASYARGDMDTPFQDMEHLYERALQEPPSYSEITSLTGQSTQTIDRQRVRAAWLLMNVEGLDVFGVHTRVWHRKGKKYSAPVLNQFSRVLGIDSQLNDNQIQELGVDLALVDVLGVKDDAIWLVQVVSSGDVVDSALGRTGKTSGDLFRSVVYKDPVVDNKQLVSLAAANQQMSLAFPDTDIATVVLVLDPDGPDFELYQLNLPNKLPQELKLKADKIRKNSIDYADKLDSNRNALFTLPHLLDNKLFRGLPPCRGGRTLGMLASAASRQLEADSLLIWPRQEFIQMLRDDFDYEIEADKVRHDLDDRLVAQGFFRKWGKGYYVSMKGIARYQYCLAKFTKHGTPGFDLDWCVVQRDRILDRFGCLS